MKQFTLFTFLIGALALAFTGPVENVSIDTEQSQITWKGYKVLGSHTGYVSVKDGDFQMQDGALVGGSFMIDMTSITCTDLEGEYADKLVGHLKSDDFFGVANFPTASFNITQVISRGTPGSYKIVGDLTIKEKTQQIKFNANISEEDGQNIAVADVTIDRSDFDVRYGSGSFFDNLGDNTIYDEFDLSIRMVLN